MKKSLYLAVYALLGTLLLLAGMALPAGAASAHTATTAFRSAKQGMAGSRPRWVWGRDSGLYGWWSPDGQFYPQVNNQFFRGNSDSGHIDRYTGRNQDNNGNQGYNRGVNQNNGGNNGNQLVNQRSKRGYRINNQYRWGNSNINNYASHQGVNQGNTGNQGLNDGFNQDNDTNNGNQVVN